MGRVTLVLGGARSGKSRYAEGLVANDTTPWSYIATAQALDVEMHERIGRHVARRGDEWATIEAPIELAAAVRQAGDGPVLIDCLTLWLSNLILGEYDIDESVNDLEVALGRRRAATVLVANEVGFGIVPADALARRFRDEAGRLNQRIAACADQVVLVVAGLPIHLKVSP